MYLTVRSDLNACRRLHRFGLAFVPVTIPPDPDACLILVGKRRRQKEGLVAESTHPPITKRSRAFGSSVMMASSGSTNSIGPPPLPAPPSSPRIYRANVDRLSDLASEQDRRFAPDIEWKVVGPMLPNLFLETFLPYQADIPQFDDVTFSQVPDEPNKESDIYTPLVSGLDSLVAHPSLPYRGMI